MREKNKLSYIWLCFILKKNLSRRTSILQTFPTIMPFPSPQHYRKSGKKKGENTVGNFTG